MRDFAFRLSAFTVASIIILGIPRFVTAETSDTLILRATEKNRNVVPNVNRSDKNLSFDDATSESLIKKSSFDPSTMMKTDEIRPGMKGYGLSVFNGVVPERFEAEVVGVRHRMMAGTDIILCHLKHPILTDIGVVAGMSGSPVYMDGKLIGAVAYGFTNVIEPLAGVTPIDDMVSVYDRTSDRLLKNVDIAESHSTFEQYQTYLDLRNNLKGDILDTLKFSMSNRNSKFLKSEFSIGGNSLAGLPNELEAEYLAAPMTISSGNALTLNAVKKLFPDMQIQSGSDYIYPASQWAPSASAASAVGGAVPDLKKLSDEISGGYSLSVPFIEGDLNMSGTGTVTWRKENKLIAFGHPMFQNGNVEFPMAASRVSAIIRSNTRPFKLGEPLGQVGMVRQDRLPAIGGVFGETAEMLPVSVSVTDKDYLGKKEFNYRVWNDKSMLSRLVMTSLFESLGTSAKAGGDSVAKYQYSFTLDDGTSFTKSNLAVDDSGAMMAAFEATLDLSIIATNPYKEVKPTGFNFKFEVADKLPLATIISADVDKAVYEPGDKVNLSWKLQRYRKDELSDSLEFPIPSFLPDGDYELRVMNNRQRESEENKRNPGGIKITDYNSLISALKFNYPVNKIYVTLTDKDTGVSVNGEELPKLPGSIISAIQDTAESNNFAEVRGNILLDAERSTGMQISGGKTVVLKVRRK